MFVNGSEYTPEEDQIIRDRFASGYTDLEIVVVLANAGFRRRTRNGIATRRARLGLIKVDRPQQRARRMQEHQPGAAAALGDHRFKLAMLAAIAGGHERAILGVVKDRRPVALKAIRHNPPRSLIGSSASMVGDYSSTLSFRHGHAGAD